MDSQKLANGLGWFSIGLGVAELAMPGQLARFIGVDNSSGNRNVLRTYGARELMAGIGILSQTQPTGWVWSRVAGDMLDLASLGNALTSSNNDKGKLLGATAAVAGVTALDVICAKQLSSENASSGSTAQRGSSGRGLSQASTSVIIDKPATELYQFWSRLSNLPRIMPHIESVVESGTGRSHWTAKLPTGQTIEWDAETVVEEPDQMIAWRSVPGSSIRNSGNVTFSAAPGNRGTLVHATMEFTPPGGAIGSAIASLFGKDLVRHNLRAFKSLMETGEVIQSDSSIHRGMHPAQPPAADELRELQTTLA